MKTQTVPIINKLGLHARAASKFVKLASSFASQVRIVKGGREANGKSIMGVMMLAASCGSNVDLIVDGPDEDLALAALAGLISARFGESE